MTVGLKVIFKGKVDTSKRVAGPWIHWNVLQALEID